MHIKKQIWIPILAIALLLVVAAGLKIETTTVSDVDYATGTAGYPGVYDDAKYGMEEIARGSVTTSYPSPMPPMDGGLEAGQDIIKTGYLEIRVTEIDKGVSEIDVIAKRYNGEVLSRSIITDAIETTGYVVLRVAAENFENAMSEIKSIATFVSSEDVSTEDVTATVIDIEARLENARAEEQSYVSILSRATTVEEILMVQNYLSQVRGTIESYEAQLEYYASRTTYSMITVSLTEEGAVQFDSPAFRPLQSIIDASQTVVVLVQDLLIALIYIVIVGGAVGLPVLLVIWIVTRVLRRKTGTRK